VVENGSLHHLNTMPEAIPRLWKSGAAQRKKTSKVFASSAEWRKMALCDNLNKVPEATPRLWKSGVAQRKKTSKVFAQSG
jgi:hypothetical protein